MRERERARQWSLDVRTKWKHTEDDLEMPNTRHLLVQSRWEREREEKWVLLGTNLLTVYSVLFRLVTTQLISPRPKKERWLFEWVSETLANTKCEWRLWSIKSESWVKTRLQLPRRKRKRERQPNSYTQAKKMSIRKDNTEDTSKCKKKL